MLFIEPISIVGRVVGTSGKDHSAQTSYPQGKIVHIHVDGEKGGYTIGDKENPPKDDCFVGGSELRGNKRILRVFVSDLSEHQPTTASESLRVVQVTDPPETRI